MALVEKKGSLERLPKLCSFIPDFGFFKSLIVRDLEKRIPNAILSTTLDAISVWLQAFHSPGNESVDISALRSESQPITIPEWDGSVFVRGHICGTKRVTADANGVAAYPKDGSV